MYCLQFCLIFFFFFFGLFLGGWLLVCLFVCFLLFIRLFLYVCLSVYLFVFDEHRDLHILCIFFAQFLLVRFVVCVVAAAADVHTCNTACKIFWYEVTET